ncbi:MAG: hypothetical protein J2P48_16560 [Alphaproteobacteria bacterium]|nr:hypothetical protein [Alphaproteobacteria bacterium]
MALALCLATAGLNLVVDPFGIYRIATLRGFNAYKPAEYDRVRLLKAFEVERVRPRAVVLGTSRSHIGIRVSASGWDTGAEPRYNLAFDGATTHEMYAYLLHAQAARPLREVVLGLDSWQLKTNPSGVRPDFDPSLLDVPDDPLRHVETRIARLRLLFNADTTMASLRTLTSQDPTAPDWLAADGQRLGDAFFHRPGARFSTAGPGAYFWDVDRKELGFKLDRGPPAHLRPGSASPNPDRSSLDYVGSIIAFCRANHIDLRIFITPAHAHQMEISAIIGEWPKIEAGKRALVRMLQEDAAWHPGAQPFPLWDFSGYSAVTIEPVPRPGSRREMSYYWDSSHFKADVGDWILDRLFGTAEPPRPVPPDFGMRLTPDNIDAAIARDRVEEARYSREHPGDVARIRALVDEVYRRIPPAQRVEIEGGR